MGRRCVNTGSELLLLLLGVPGHLVQRLKGCNEKELFSTVVRMERVA